MSTTYSVDLLFKAPKTTALDQLNRQLSELDRKSRSIGGADPFQGIESSAKGATGAVVGLNVAAKGLLATFGPLLAAVSVLGTAKFVFDKTAEVEKQTKSLETLTGSLTKTKDIIAELQEFGAVTPFTSTELIDTAQRLTAFGVSADRVVEVTKRLGDVAGATGADLDGIVTAYGQVVAKGRLQGEELLQFQERGVGVLEELRKMYGLTGEEMQKALSKGQVSAEALEVAIERLTSKGGKYANGAIAQSTTLSGKLSTLRDNIESIARTIGQKLTPVIDFVLTKAIQATNALNKLLDRGKEEKYFNRATAQVLQEERAKGARTPGPGSTLVTPVDGSRPPDGIPLGGVTWTPAMITRRDALVEKFRKQDEQLQQGKPGATRTNPPATPSLTGGTAGTGAGFKLSPKAQAAVNAANKLGVSPLDLLQIIGAETGGAFSPGTPGIGAAAGRFGLIQFGPNEARQYGASPNQSFEEQIQGPVVRYLQDRFKNVGRSTQGASLLDLYTAVNQGSPLPRLYDSKDGNNITPRSFLPRIQGYRNTVLDRFFGGTQANVPYGGAQAGADTAQGWEEQQRLAQQRQQGLTNAAAERLEIERQSALIGKDRITQLEVEDEYGKKILKSKLDALNADQTLDPAVRQAERDNLVAGFELQAKQRQADYEEIQRSIREIETSAGDLARTLGRSLTADTDPLQSEIEAVKDELLQADRAAEELLQKLRDLGGINPETEAARKAIGKLREDIAGADADKIAADRLARPLRDNLTAEGERLKLERGAIRQGRGLNRQEEVSLDPTFKALPKAQQDALTQQAAINDGIDQANKRYQEQVELVQSIGQELAQGIGGAIAGLIQGTTTLNQALSDILGNIGQILIQSAVTGLLSKVSIGGIPLLPGRAEGGPVTGGSPYLVGEKGPELFVPRSAGKVLSNADSVRAMSRYNTANSIQNRQVASQDEAAREGRSDGRVAMPPIRLETTVINGVEYATVEQVKAASQQASIQGAKLGEQRTLRRMQFSPSSRRRIGL